MDFSKVYCISSECAGKGIQMRSTGAGFGGVVEYANFKCTCCGLKLIVIVEKPNYEYTISAKERTT